MKLAKIIDGVVRNVALTEDPESLQSIGYLAVSMDVQKGWITDGEGGFVLPPPGETLAPLSRRQFRWMLAHTKVSGKRLEVIWSEVEAALEAADAPEYAVVRSNRDAAFFEIQATLDLVAALAPVMQAASGVTVSESTIREAWEQALFQ